jgi:hypothetical protein
MRAHSTMVDHWLGLSHPDLTEQVRRAVRGGSAGAPTWSEVAAHPVLTARVRGIFSALQSQMADHRDNAMWTLWINTARRALNTAPPPVSAEAPDTQPTTPPPAEEFSTITTPSAPAPLRQRHVVPPVTFLTASQTPANSTEL